LDINSNLGIKEGLEGSYNYFTVIRKDGSEENYNIVTNVKLNKGDKELVTNRWVAMETLKNRPIQNWRRDIKKWFYNNRTASEFYNYSL
jgi:N-methylhydantoinase B/oxoprolinase/acetone carboxylase alpha subunit